MKLIKENKVIMIITSVIILIPIVVGLMFWNELPKEIATHFGTNGEPNDWSSKEFAVFGLPLFLLAIHWFCAVATSSDPKNRNIGNKMFVIVMLICPIASVICGVSIYGYELGWNVGGASIAQIFMAMIYIIVGNYLPKCKQNYTVGIKIPWTLNNEENWNKTHRLAGKIWVVAGLLMMVNLFVGVEELMIVLILISVIVPVMYSYFLYNTNK